MDPFPSRPLPPSGRRAFSWTQRSRWNRNSIHAIVLYGEPGASPTDLLANAGAPSPTLPRDGRLVFHQAMTSWEATKPAWSYSSIAIVGHPLLLASDVAACEIEEHTSLVYVDGPQKELGPQPWLRVTFTEGGNAKLRALPTDMLVCAAFGDDALTESWDPHQKEASFQVDGVSLEMKQRRARALQAAGTRR